MRKGSPTTGGGASTWKPDATSTVVAALENDKEVHEILNVTVWRARILSRWPGAICVSALGRKRSALLWKVRCAAIHSSTKGWWRCRCAGRANGWAERRSCGTSRFIDVQGAAAAKELRRKGLVVLDQADLLSPAVQQQMLLMMPIWLMAAGGVNEA